MNSSILEEFLTCIFYFSRHSELGTIERMSRSDDMSWIRCNKKIRE